MSPAPRKRNRRLGLGLVLLVIAGLIAASNRTAVPVIVDVSLATLVASVSAMVVLAAAIRRETRGRRVVGWVALTLAAALAVGAAYHRFGTYRADEVRFANGDVELAGTVYRPRSPGPHPGIVFVHGSGPETREEYAFHARRFARAGFVALAYDKRGTGASGGRLYAADYRDYAGDAVAAVRHLSRSEAVDGGCVGLVGFSEGEWVAPLAATLADEVGFLIVVAPSGLSPAGQVRDEIARRMVERGHGKETVERALALNERVFDYQRTGVAPEGLAEDLEAAATEPWFADAGDIPPELYAPEEYAWWRSVMDFDPGPVWERIDVPVLLLKGGRDPNSDPGRARREIEAALERGRNPAHRFVVFPDGDHALLRWPLGEGVPPPVFADGYLDTLVRWAREVPCVDRPRSGPGDASRPADLERHRRPPDSRLAAMGRESTGPTRATECRRGQCRQGPPPDGCS